MNSLLGTIENLKEEMSDCKACDLCTSRKQVVFGTGNYNPKIMIIGEAPGADEDEQGVPFVGKAGEKLDKILKFLEIDRKDIFITNAVLCRPPGNRNPSPEELEACKWRLDLQIQLLKPELIIVLGKVAVQQLKGGSFNGPLSQFFFDKIGKQDGWLHYKTNGHVSKVLVTYHPSYLLRRPKQGYRTVLPHWQKVRRWIQHDR
jgi:DNA polymerase